MFNSPGVYTHMQTSETSCSLASPWDLTWWPGWSCVAQARQMAAQHVWHHNANGIPCVWQFSLGNTWEKRDHTVFSEINMETCTVHYLLFSASHTCNTSHCYVCKLNALRLV